MKQFFYVFMLIGIVLVSQSFAQKRGAANAGRAVEFERYHSYFESNKSPLKGRISYTVFTDQEKFDEVFGAAATMGNNSFLPDDAFDTKLVFAVIKRGKSLRTYDLKKVTSTGGKLFVWYNVKDEKMSSATFSSHLIVGVEKGNYTQVAFMENGKLIRTLPIPKTK